MRENPFHLTVSTQAGDDLEDYLTSVRHETAISVVFTFRIILPLVGHL